MHQHVMRAANDKGKIDLLEIKGCANVLEETVSIFIFIYILKENASECCGFGFAAREIHRELPVFLARLWIG